MTISDNIFIFVPQQAKDGDYNLFKEQSDGFFPSFEPMLW
jgi:hypothetical protein